MMKDGIVRNPRRSDADDRSAEVDAETVLDNVVELDKLLDDGNSRREVDSLPVLELSKHMRVRQSAQSSSVVADAGTEAGGSSSTVAKSVAEALTTES